MRSFLFCKILEDNDYEYVDSIGFRELSGFQDKQERSSVLSQLKAKCDMPECNPTKCRKGRNDHAI